MSFWVCWNESCTRDGKAEKYLVRTTRTFPGCVEMQSGKQKLSLNWNWPEVLKTTRKIFFKYGNRRNRAQYCLLLNSRGELVTNNVRRQRFSALGSHLCWCFEPQALGEKIQGDANTDPLSVRELVWELLQEFDPYKSMGPDKIHLRLSRKLLCVVGLLCHLWEVVGTGGCCRRLEESSWKHLQRGLKAGSRKL